MSQTIKNHLFYDYSSEAYMEKWPINTNDIHFLIGDIQCFAAEKIHHEGKHWGYNSGDL